MYSIKGLGQSYTGDDVTVFSDGQPVEVFSDGAPIEVFSDGAPVEVFSDGAPIEVFSDFAQAIDTYEASMEVIGELQCALQQKGVDPGPLDGLWGTKTQKGLTAFAKGMGQKAMSAPVMAELGLDLGEVEAAKSFQAANKKLRPAAYIPNSVTRCGAGIFDVPGAAAAAAGAGSFLQRNWKWLVAAGVLTAGAIGVGAYVAMRKKDEGEFGAIIPEGNPGFLYGNQYLQQTYGLGRAREMGSVTRRGYGHKLSPPAREAYRRGAAKRRKRGQATWPRSGRTRPQRGMRGMGLITPDSVYTYQNPWLQQIYK